MPRLTRVEFPGALYHVSINAVAGVKIFEDDIDRKRFLRILDFGIRRFSLKLHAYVLLDDGYRLLVETPRGDLSKALQYVNSHYVAYIKTRRRTTGRLFQGRYKSPVVEKSRYLLKLCRHLHIIPVLDGLASRPEQYRWSSHNRYLQPVDKAPAIFTRDVLSQFRGTPRGSRRKYQQYVLSGVDADASALEKLLMKRSVIGGPDFIEFAQREAKKPPVGTIDPVKIIELTADYFKTPMGTIKKNRIKPNLPRNVAIYLCRNVTTISLEELGELFEVGPSSICNTTKRVEAHRDSNGELDKALREVEKAVKRNAAARI